MNLVSKADPIGSAASSRNFRADTGRASRTTCSVGVSRSRLVELQAGRPTVSAAARKCRHVLNGAMTLGPRSGAARRLLRLGGPFIRHEGFARRRTRRERSASLTDAELAKRFATSGSSTTTLLPSAKRLAYLLRSPLEKSYSSRRSGSGRLFLGLLIRCDARSAWPASPDLAQIISSLGVDHNQQTPAKGRSDERTGPRATSSMPY
jgi:hypothetical protein